MCSIKRDLLNSLYRSRSKPRLLADAVRPARRRTFLSGKAPRFEPHYEGADDKLAHISRMLSITDHPNIAESVYQKPTRNAGDPWFILKCP